MPHDDAMLGQYVTSVLAAAAAAGDAPSSPFDLKCTLPLHRYLHRMQQYAELSAGAYSLATIYLRRLRARRGLGVSRLNMHKLSMLGLVLAHKFLEDVPKLNAYYAKIAGVPLRELNALEMYLLESLDYCLYAGAADIAAAEALLRTGGAVDARDGWNVDAAATPDGADSAAGPAMGLVSDSDSDSDSDACMSTPSPSARPTAATGKLPAAPDVWAANAAAVHRACAAMQGDTRRPWRSPASPVPVPVPVPAGRGREQRRERRRERRRRESPLATP